MHTIFLSRIWKYQSKWKCEVSKLQKCKYNTSFFARESLIHENISAAGCCEQITALMQLVLLKSVHPPAICQCSKCINSNLGLYTLYSFLNFRCVHYILLAINEFEGGLTHPGKRWERDTILSDTEDSELANVSLQFFIFILLVLTIYIIYC